MNTYPLSTSFLDGLPLEELLLRVAKAGFYEIEICVGDTESWFRDPGRTRHLLQSTGVALREVHVPREGWDVGALDEAARRASIEAVEATLTKTAELGCGMVIYHPNRPVLITTQEEYDAVWARSRESLETVAERARTAKINISVENMLSLGDLWPGARVAELLKLIEGLGDHVGICLDTGHAHFNGLDVASEALEGGPRLFALHVHDNDGSDNQHLPPGRGTIDWNAFLDALDETDFDGPRTFEVRRHDDVETVLSELAQVRQEWEHRYCQCRDQ